MFRILFLGGAKRVSLAERFVAEGRTRKTPVEIFSYELTDEVPISAVGKIIIGEKWTSPNILSHLTDTIERNAINVVIPSVDPATVIAAELALAGSGVFVCGSPIEACRTFFDKQRSEDWFSSNNFPTPKFNGEFPAIAKPVQGSASAGIQIFETRKALDTFLEEHREQDYLLQRFIDGWEYTVDCYLDRSGKTLAAIPRVRLTVAGGEVLKSRTIDDPEIERLVRAILEKGRLRGPVNVQVLREKNTGSLYVVEVNPRFGGGCILSIEAGASFPAFVLNEAVGLPNEPVRAWNRNLLMMRANREFFR